jgi:Family of unknown function (DUF5681)
VRLVGRPFPKGVSGNPGGRAKGLKEVTELARHHAPEAIDTLVRIMRDPKANAAARGAAANALLDRGYGKAVATVSVENTGRSLEQMLIDLHRRRQEAAKLIELPPPPKAIDGP